MEVAAVDYAYLASFLDEDEAVVRRMGGLTLARAVRMRIDQRARDALRLPQSPVVPYKSSDES